MTAAPDSTPKTAAPTQAPTSASTPAPSDFIRDQAARDQAEGVNGGVVATRFPPEPNGFLHIGHAKSICLNFGIAADLGGTCNLRMDDTNPLTEDGDFVQAIEEDVRWLGFEWNGDVKFASDEFEQLYVWAKHLIRQGVAYVDDQSAEEIAATRGAIGVPVWKADGAPAASRRTSICSNVCARANSRTARRSCGPRSIWRIRTGRCGTRSCIASAMCTITAPEAIGASTRLTTGRTGRWMRSRASHIPYARLSSTRTGRSTTGSSTICRCHRIVRGSSSSPASTSLTRSCRSASSRSSFATASSTGTTTPACRRCEGCAGAGIPRPPSEPSARISVSSKSNAVHEIELLESFIRDELNRTAPRRMAVLRPLKVVIENFPDDRVDWLDAVNNPEDPTLGARKIPFSRVIYVERDDFMETPAAKFFRLSPGNEVRLRYAYFLRCTDVVKDEGGEIVELRATYDPATAGGQAPDGRKVKATLHWVSADHGVQHEVRLYEHLFSDPFPDAHEDRDPIEFLNPNSREVAHRNRRAGAGRRQPMERSSSSSDSAISVPRPRLIRHRCSIAPSRSKTSGPASRSESERPQAGRLKRTARRAEAPTVELSSDVEREKGSPAAAALVDADPWSGIDHGKLWPGTYRAKSLLLALLAVCSGVIAGPWPALAVVAVVIPWNEWSGRWHRRHGRAHPLVCADQVLAVGVSLMAPAVILGSVASVMSCAPLGVLASGRRVAQRFTIGAIALLAIGAAVRQDWSTVVFSAPLLGCTIAAQRFVDYVLAKQRSSVSRFEDLLDGLQAAVVEVDLSNRRITYLNRHAGLLLADEPESLSALVELVHPDDRVGLRAALDRAIGLPAEPMSVDVRTIAGSEVRHLAARATVSMTEDRSRLRLVLIDVSERKHIELELEHRATHDALTELPNRVLDPGSHGLIDPRLGEPRRRIRISDRSSAKRRSVPSSQRHAVLVLDLDSFKDINDGLGHHHGDLLLVEIADRLRRVVRPCDTVARLGGDEFAVWLDGCDEAGARDIATRTRAAVAAPYSAEGVVLYPEVSIGIACFPGDADTTPDLLRLADMAMYRAKRTGTGYAMYASELDGSGPSRFALQAELRDAIRNGALQPYFQPLVDGASGRIISCEALVRWHHPERGILTPAEFWPVVQSAGLSSEVASTMLRAVFGHLRGWHRAGIAVPVAVNLSTSDVCDEAVLDLIEHEISQGAYPPELLTVELTETELLAADVGGNRCVTAPRGTRRQDRGRRLRHRLLVTRVAPRPSGDDGED